MRELLGNRALLKILRGGVVFAAIDVFQYYVPVYAGRLGLSTSTVGIIMSCFPAAAFISRIYLRRLLKTSAPEVMLRRSFLLTTAALVVFPRFENVPMLGALAFAYGFGPCVGQPITLILAYEATTKGRTGEVVGIRERVNQLSHVVAPVAFGAIGSVAGLMPVLFISGATLVWGALILRPRNLAREGGK